jgi:crotonobetainyl-CoA:carnitine CoA-transferase CaiB-like acyl-CoA transferase
MYSVIGILAALAQREKTGKGAYIDTALVDTQVGVLSNQAMNYLISGKVPKRAGNTHPNIVPYQMFPTADGNVIVATGNDRQFQKFCTALGQPQLGEDPAYRTNTDRLAQRDELIGKLTALTSKLKRDELLHELEKVQVPAGPINNIQQVFADPQVIHRGMQLKLASAAAKGGSIPGVRTPIVVDGEAMASPRPSPRLGEHTAEILREIGEA